MTGKAKKLCTLSVLFAGAALVSTGAAKGAVWPVAQDVNAFAVPESLECPFAVDLSAAEGPGDVVLAKMSGGAAKSGNGGQSGKDDSGKAGSGDDNSNARGDNTGDQERYRVRDRDGGCDDDRDGDCDGDRDRDRDRDRYGSIDDANES